MTSTRPRFIIFNGAPSLSTLLDHDSWLDSYFEWRFTQVELSPLGDARLAGAPTSSWPEPPSALHRADLTESQFQDALAESSAAGDGQPQCLLPPSAQHGSAWERDSWAADSTARSDKADTAQRAAPSKGVNIWGDADETSYAVYDYDSRRAMEHTRAAEVTVEDSCEAGTSWQGTQLLPPPRASFPPISPSPRSARPSASHISRGPSAHESYLPNETLSTESDSGSLSLSDPALPPNLPWDHFTLRSLRALRATLAKRPASSVTASILGLVVDVSEARFLGERRNRRAGFAVEDGSGARVECVLWEEWVDSWAGVVRRGDVVFLGNVKLNLYKNALQAQPTHQPLSRAQICWRLLKLDDADEGYGFDTKWGESNPEAAKVLEVVQWAGSAYRGVFDVSRGGWRG